MAQHKKPLTKTASVRELHALIAWEWRAHQSLWLALIVLIFALAVGFSLTDAEPLRVLGHYLKLAALVLLALGTVALELILLSLKAHLDDTSAALLRLRLYVRCGTAAMVLIGFSLL